MKFSNGNIVYPVYRGESVDKYHVWIKEGTTTNGRVRCDHGSFVMVGGALKEFDLDSATEFADKAGPQDLEIFNKVAKGST